MPTLKEQNEKYNEYVHLHCSNVLVAYNKYATKILDIMGNPSLIDDLYSLALIHDKSKWSIYEYDGYRKHFNPVDNTEKEDPNTKIEYDRAWLHHMNTNPHHPEYWIMRDNYDGVRPIEMERVYIAELILDWASVGMIFNNNPYKWFIKNKKYYKEYLAPNTYNIIEKIVTELWG
jgi:hypothetical protein